MSRGRSTITVTVQYSMNDHGEQGRRVTAALAAVIRGEIARVRALMFVSEPHWIEIDVEEVEG